MGSRVSPTIYRVLHSLVKLVPESSTVPRFCASSAFDAKGDGAFNVAEDGLRTRYILLRDFGNDGNLFLQHESGKVMSNSDEGKFKHSLRHVAEAVSARHMRGSGIRVPVAATAIDFALDQHGMQSPPEAHVASPWVVTSVTSRLEQ
eukprot:TRINITY_DN4956_c0_g1_i1.p2 TRINITY_DN4956_c0_g1~~TRINITY_DN4956_c0_g1_i1.p2  ORF type:complete len:147 (-),score=16.96 TRINITY_DN4956_c0_g1_i1:1001-1441(-)